MSNSNIFVFYYEWIMSRSPGNSAVEFYAHAAVEFFIFMRYRRIIMSKVPANNLRSGQYKGKKKNKSLNALLSFTSP